MSACSWAQRYWGRLGTVSMSATVPRQLPSLGTNLGLVPVFEERLQRIRLFEIGLLLGGAGCSARYASLRQPLGQDILQLALRAEHVLGPALQRPLEMLCCDLERG